MADKIKIYTRREEFFNASSHITGVLFGAAAAFPLVKLALKTGDGAFTAGLIFYWLSFLAMFGASSWYHLSPPQKKSLARKFDHCAIYLLITGTYAPLITGAVKTPPGYLVLISLCALTVLGITAKIFFASKFHFLEVIIYLAMGWACVFIAEDLLAAMPRQGLYFLLYGGLAYTSGVIFYVIRREFFHGLWHLFVLGGAVLQFFAILSIGNI